MVDKIFHVLTDFRFEVGSALLGTERLQGAVEGLQSKVDSTVTSFTHLGASFAMGHSGITGMLGLLGTAVNTSDHFFQSQLKLANILGANRDHLTGNVGTFNKELQMSEVLMQRISEQAMEFALPGAEYLNITERLASALLPRGVAGKNLEVPMQMARGMLKSAPILGIHPEDAMGQLQRAIEGGATMGDTLFRRITADAPQVFKGLGSATGAGRGKGNNLTAAFNVAPIEKRVKMLTDALLVFANNTDVTRARVQSLSGQIEIFKNLVSPSQYMTNIFKPLGDALIKMVVPALTWVNNKLQTEGREFMQLMAQFMDIFSKSPKGLVANILMFRQLKADLSATKGILSLTGVILGIGGLLKFLGITGALALPYVGPLLIFFQVLAEGIGRAVPHMKYIIYATGALIGISVALFKWGAFFSMIGNFLFAEVLIPMLIVFGFMQLFSKAAAIAHMKEADQLPALGVRFTKAMVQLTNVFYQAITPLADLFNMVAEWISPLFSMVGITELAVSAVERITETIMELYASFSAMGEFLATGIFKIASGDWGNMLGEMQANASQMYEKRWEENRMALRKPGGAVQNMTTNIGQVNINNQFKQDIEPDRIAFALKDQLLKAATNPTQAKRKSIGFGSRIGALEGAK